MDTFEALSAQLFPKAWSRLKLSSEDVQLYLSKDNELPMLKTKSVLGHNEWDFNKLQKLIEEKGKSINENWTVPDYGQNLLVWKESSLFSAQPDAIMSFNLSVTAKTKTQKASIISLHNNLIWVKPEKRGKGFGSHLIAHFICYLEQCNIRYPLIQESGVKFTFHADFDTEGGEHLSNYISEYLEHVSDSWARERFNAGLPIKALEVVADY